MWKLNKYIFTVICFLFIRNVFSAPKFRKNQVKQTYDDYDDYDIEYDDSNYNISFDQRQTGVGNVRLNVDDVVITAPLPSQSITPFSSFAELLAPFVMGIIPDVLNFESSNEENSIEYEDTWSFNEPAQNEAQSNKTELNSTNEQPEISSTTVTPLLLAANSSLNSTSYSNNKEQTKQLNIPVSGHKKNNKRKSDRRRSQYHLGSILKSFFEERS